MTDPFLSAGLLAASAYQHIRSLRDQIIAFGKGPNAEIREELQADKTTIAKICFPNGVPPRMSLTARAAFADLRSALDHAGFACAQAKTNDPKQTAFPFAQKRRDIMSCAKRGSRDIPAEIFAKMVSFKPYGDEDGNALLYSLAEMRNLGEHRFVVPMAASNMDTHVEWVRDYGPAPSGLQQPQVFLNSLNESDGSVLIARYDAQFHRLKIHRVMYRFSIGGGSLAGEEPISTLLALSALAKTILAEIRSEAARIGLFG